MMKLMSHEQKCQQVQNTGIPGLLRVCRSYSLGFYEALLLFPCFIRHELKKFKAPSCKFLSQLQSFIYRLRRGLALAQQTGQQHDPAYSTQILKCIWPSFIKAVRPQRLNQIFRTLRETMKITEKDLCFMVIEHNCSPDAYPLPNVEFVLKQFHTNLENLDYEQCITPLLYSECSQAFYYLSNITHEFSSPDTSSDYVLATIERCVKKCLVRKNKILEILKVQSTPLVWARALNRCLSQDENLSVVLKVLRLMLLAECVHFFYTEISQQQEYEHRVLKKICTQGLSRMLKYLYSSGVTVKCTLMKWVVISRRSESGVWRPSELDSSLFLHLKVLEQIESEKKPGAFSQLTLRCVEELLGQLQGQYQELPTIYQRALQQNMVPMQNRDGVEMSQMATVSKKTPSSKQTENFEMALISEILKKMEVEEFHKIYVLFLSLLTSLRSSTPKENPQMKHFVTCSQQDLAPNARKASKRQMDLVKIYMSLSKKIGTCDASLRYCTLIQQINVGLFQLAGHLPDNYEELISTIQYSLKKSEYIDFEWHQAGEGLSVEGIIPKFLEKSQQSYDLLTLYQLTAAEQEFNRSFPSLTQKIRRKQSCETEPALSCEGQSLSQEFTEKTLALVASYIKNQKNLQLIVRILNCDSIRLKISIFLNIFNYAAGVESDTKVSNAKETLLKLMKFYIHNTDIRILKRRKVPLKKQHEYLQLKQFLLKAPVYLEEFRKLLPSGAEKRNKNKVSAHKGLSGSQKYAQIMLKFSKATELLKIAEQYEKINCIQETLYFLNYFFRQRGKKTKGFEDINAYYEVLQRMDPNVKNCLECLQSSANRCKQSDQLCVLFDLDTRSALLHPNRQFNIDNGTKINLPIPEFYSNLSCLIFFSEGDSEQKSLNEIQYGLFQGLHRVIHRLEEPSEICKVIRDIRYLTVILRFFRSKGSAHAVLDKITQVDSFRDSQLLLRFLADSQSRMAGKELTKEIEQFKWDEMFRFQKHQQINGMLWGKAIENMNFEELRAGLISNFKLQNFEKTLIYSDELARRKNKQDKSRQKTSDRYIQLSFYEIVAKYRSIIFYPFRKIMADWALILQAFHGSNPLPLSRHNTQVVYEIYRFICESYHSLRPDEEKSILDLLLRYHNMVENSPSFEDSCDARQVEKEAFYFILRFLLCKSSCSEDLVTIFCSRSSYRPETIMAFQDFLILSIGDSTSSKNKLIEQLLTKVAEYSPVASCWWISSLLLHCRVDERAYSRNDYILKETGVRIKESLRQKGIDISEHLKWIEKLLELALSSTDDQEEALKRIKLFKEERVPKSLTSPFDRSVALLKTLAVKCIGDGKSKPISIVFQTLGHGGETKTVQIIVKKTAQGGMGYQIERCAANFFKACGVVDRQVTYSVANLCKYCLAIEHIPHYDSLKSVMGDDEFSQIKLQQNIKRIGGCYKRLKAFYDEELLRFNYGLYEFLTDDYHIPVREWWKKYTNFVSTYAQWAFLGYTVGLGDRHDANCLVKEDGKIIQIDFEYIFSSGLMLPCPEWVPMRITKNLCSELSIVEPYGLFYSEFTKAAQKCKTKQRQFWAALSYFAYAKQKELEKPVCDRAELNPNVYESSLKLIKQSNDNFSLREMYFGWGAHR